MIDSNELCATLTSLLHQKINASPHPLSFADFMQLALYAPGLGYYHNGSHKLGAAGDFITAPMISPLFSACLAKQCIELLDSLPHPHLLELGAGDGTMAADILTYFNKQNIDVHYSILEISPELRERQQKKLKMTHPQLFSRITWLNTLPENFIGVILANEVIDALPVHCFRYANNTLFERGVSLKNNTFVWECFPASHALQKALDPRLFQENYQSEIHLQLPAWLKSLNQSLKQGAMLFIDYGFEESAFYAPSRNNGTLMCHSRHHAHPDPFWKPGLQDITAHINFSQLALAADQLKLQIAGYTDQGNFLLSCGILDELNALHDPMEKFREQNAVKKLTLPHEMGELFKVIALTKDMPEKTPLGFQLRDKMERL
jgi:SAM-dependent MidA family methyltransferase